MNRLSPIQDLFNVEKGSLQSTKYVEGDYNFITAGSEWKKHNQYDHDSEALIVAVAASGSLGRVHYVKGKFIASDLCFILTPKDNKALPVDLSFYKYVFKYIRDDLVKSTATGSSKLAINKTNFGNYKIPYFPIVLQQDYKKRLNLITSKRDSLDTIIANQAVYTKQLRRRLLQDAITGFLTEEWRLKNLETEPASVLLSKIKNEKQIGTHTNKIKKTKQYPEIKKGEIPYTLPKTWEWCRLGDIVTHTDYGTSEKAHENITGVTVLGMGNIQDMEILLKSGKNISFKNKAFPKLLLKHNDLLFNRTNSYELVGKTGVYKGKDDEYTFASYLIRLRFNTNLIHPEFISIIINSDWFRKNVIEPQIIQQTGQANFNGTKLNCSMIPLAPYEEQKEVVSKVARLVSRIRLLEKITCENDTYLNEIVPVLMQEAAYK